MQAVLAYIVASEAKALGMNENGSLVLIDPPPPSSGPGTTICFAGGPLASMTLRRAARFICNGIIQNRLADDPSPTQETFRIKGEHVLSLLEDAPEDMLASVLAECGLFELPQHLLKSLEAARLLRMLTALCVRGPQLAHAADDGGHAGRLRHPDAGRQ